MRIEVTQEDIDNGEQCSGSRCPVALAIRRALPSARSVSVTETEVDIDDEVWGLPVYVQDFIEEFDFVADPEDKDDADVPLPEGPEFKPFEFELTPLDHPA